MHSRVKFAALAFVAIFGAIYFVGYFLFVEIRHWFVLKGIGLTLFSEYGDSVWDDVVSYLAVSSLLFGSLYLGLRLWIAIVLRTKFIPLHAIKDTLGLELCRLLKIDPE